MLNAQLGQPFWLSLFLTDGATNMYPRVLLYEGNNAAPTDTLDLNSNGGGSYMVEWTPSVAGQWRAVYTVYVDAPRTIVAFQYPRSVDQIQVESFSNDTGFSETTSGVSRALGLLKDNTVLDNMIYDSCDQLISCRMRCYDSAANANAATPGGSETTGLIAEYSISSTYSAPNLLSFMKTIRIS